MFYTLDKVIGKVKKPSWLISIILFFSAATFELIYSIGNFNGGFLPVVGNLFSMTISVALWAAVPVFLLLKKERFAKISFGVLAAYWVINASFLYFSNMGYASIDTGLRIAVAVFAFFVACVLIAAVVFLVLGYLKKNAKMNTLAILIFVGGFLFYLILFGLMAGLYSDLFANWNNYFSLVSTYLLMPAAMFFGYLFFCFEPPVYEEKTVDDFFSPESQALLGDFGDPEEEFSMDFAAEEEPAAPVASAEPVAPVEPVAPAEPEVPALLEFEEEAEPEAPVTPVEPEEPAAPIVFEEDAAPEPVKAPIAVDDEEELEDLDFEVLAEVEEKDD